MSACGAGREFRLSNVFRRAYHVQPFFPEGKYYLASILVGEQDVTGKPVELQSGSLPIRLVYKADGGTLRGTVERCDGGTVVAVPQEQELRANVYYLVRRASCDASGNFEINNVRPGHYLVLGFDSFYRQRMNEFSSMTQDLLNRGVSATVRAGEQETMNPRVGALPQ